MSYQRYGIDSVEPANIVLQLLTREPTQKLADGADTVHHRIDIHPGLQMQGEASESQLSHCSIYDTTVSQVCKLQTGWKNVTK